MQGGSLKIKNKLQDLLLVRVRCTCKSTRKYGGGKCSSTSVPTALTRITDLERVRACKIMHRKRVYVRARVCRVCLHSYS